MLFLCPRTGLRFTPHRKTISASTRQMEKTLNSSSHSSAESGMEDLACLAIRPRSSEFSGHGRGCERDPFFRDLFFMEDTAILPVLFMQARCQKPGLVLFSQLHDSPLSFKQRDVATNPPGNSRRFPQEFSSRPDSLPQSQNFLYWQSLLPISRCRSHPLSFQLYINIYQRHLRFAESESLVPLYIPRPRTINGRFSRPRV